MRVRVAPGGGVGAVVMHRLQRGCAGVVRTFSAVEIARSRLGVFARARQDGCVQERQGQSHRE